jgi:hypothetical protein
MEQRDIDEFQDVMGNKGTVLMMTYKNATDKGKYSGEDLRTMLECATLVTAAISRMIRRTQDE